ncbi:MAG TPA: hypothetical protein VFC47_15085 [Caulobacteraceae bacterium]|nr:hypothetical protein [Caulobacteraceae bacterium]
MSIHSLPPEDTADHAPDPAVLRAERRLRLLAELAEIGMELARALKPTVNADEPPAADEAKSRRRDPAEVFAGLSRAIRLTLALEAKADEELRDLIRGVTRTREETRARAADEALAAEGQRCEDRQSLICGLVTELARERITREADFEHFDLELDHLLIDDYAFWSDPARPIREVVERFCDYFDLTPDWSRWQSDRWAAPAPVWPWAAQSETPPAPPEPRAMNGAHDLE